MTTVADGVNCSAVEGHIGDLVLSSSVFDDKTPRLLFDQFYHATLLMVSFVSWKIKESVVENCCRPCIISYLSKFLKDDEPASGWKVGIKWRQETWGSSVRWFFYEGIDVSTKTFFDETVQRGRRTGLVRGCVWRGREREGWKQGSSWTNMRVTVAWVWIVPFHNGLGVVHWGWILGQTLWQFWLAFHSLAEMVS